MFDEIKQVFDGFLFSVVASNKKVTHASLVKELFLFQKVVNVDEVVKPLEWWKENEVQFLVVGFLDQQLLAIHGFQIKTKCIFNVNCILISL
jgi:hypothetical protein